MPRMSYRGRSAERLFTVIGQRGLTVSETARRAGLSRAAFYLVRNGRVGITAQFMDRCAAVLDLPADDLFPLTEDALEVPA